ncbi:MAG: SipW-dependent-type signal peptide-containing protein [Firmicutes bacterium]|nr:SipW-dependent-type signal peptide-containing protein [Bacillota bacterium]
MSLCAVLLVAASVLGTMAYLTDSKDVKNTFTVGNVAIKLDEAKVDDMGNLVKNQDGTLVNRVTENDYKLLPGHTYVKDPTVTVLKPSVASYVRMKVTFNKASALIAMCTDPDWEEDAPTEIKNAWPLLYMVNFTDKSVKWDGIIMDNMFESENMLNNTKYCVYDKAADTLTFYYYYTETVAAPAADVKLDTLFDSITVPQWVTGDQLAKLDGFQITAVAEAIQADGFVDANGDPSADAAWTAFAAQMYK